MSDVVLNTKVDVETKRRLVAAQLALAKLRPELSKNKFHGASVNAVLIYGLPLIEAALEQEQANDR